MASFSVARPVTISAPLFWKCICVMVVTSMWLPAEIWAQEQRAVTIVYTHAPDAGPPWPIEDIYLVGADGGDVKALTSDGNSHNPAWSPDGKRVLFVHDSALQMKPFCKKQKEFESYHPVELYVKDRDGGNRHLLRRIEPVIFSAAWSPDGKTLAVSCMPEAWMNRPDLSGDPMRNGLFVLAADGQGEPQLLFRNALNPSWSPDGKQLAFSVERPRGQWAVHVADSDGSHDAQLTDPFLIAGSPAWSPDGKLIVFDQFGGQRNQQVFVMNADGSHRRQISQGADWSCGHPSWSPDGKRLVFSCRSTSPACGGGLASVGTALPECTRRLFSASSLDLNSTPIQLNQNDSASPAFSPR